MNEIGIFKKIIIVAVEKHMLANYQFLIGQLKQYCSVQMIILPHMSVNSFKERIRKGNHIFSLIKENITQQLGGVVLHDTLVIYSNSEGFILSNKSKWMPTLVGCKEVVLQHGLMPTSIPNLWIRKIVNHLVYVFKGYYLWGLGFGGVKCDMIIVWGDIYAKFLIRSMGWKPSSILVSGKLLKTQLAIQPEKLQHDERRKCLFLLQDMAAFYDISYSKQIMYFKEIAKVLGSCYDEVVVRKHPKMDDSIYDEFSGICNVRRSMDTLETEIIISQRVYSFFSSGMLDAFLFGKEVVAIYLSELPIDLYRMFKRVVFIDDLVMYEEEHLMSDEYAVIDQLYFNTDNNLQVIINRLLKK